MGKIIVVSYPFPGTFIELFFGVRSPCVPEERAREVPSRLGA